MLYQYGTESDFKYSITDTILCLMFQNTRTTGFFFALSQSISFIYKQKAFYRPKNLWYTYLSGPDEISSEVNCQIALQNRKKLWFCRLCFAHWLELPSLFSGEKCVSVISSFFYCKNERERERERDRENKTQKIV